MNQECNDKDKNRYPSAIVAAREHFPDAEVVYTGQSKADFTLILRDEKCYYILDTLYENEPLFQFLLNDTPVKQSSLGYKNHRLMNLLSQGTKSKRIAEEILFHSVPSDYYKVTVMQSGDTKGDIQMHLFDSLGHGKRTHCINCGSPVITHETECPYCLTHYNTSKFNIIKNQKLRKRAIYGISLWGGLLTVVSVYTILWGYMSESILVTITPYWFFSIVFGWYGFKAEDLMHEVVVGRAEDFKGAYKNWLVHLGDHNPIAWLFFSILFFPFSFIKKSPPLLAALLGSAIWGALLILFFIGIWGSSII